MYPMPAFMQVPLTYFSSINFKVLGHSVCKHLAWYVMRNRKLIHADYCYYCDIALDLENAFGEAA